MAFEECPHAVLAAQPVGAWSAEVFHRVVGALREQLAVEGLTRPHWWTRDHAAGTPPGRWNRATLVRRPARYDDLATDSTAVFDGLTARGRLLESAATGAVTLTEDGEAARLRARERNHRVHRVHLRAHQGVDEADVVTTINVLRRTTADMGGEGDLPDRPARPGPARPGPARHGPARSDRTGRPARRGPHRRSTGVASCAGPGFRKGSNNCTPPDLLSDPARRTSEDPQARAHRRRHRRRRPARPRRRPGLRRHLVGRHRPRGHRRPGGHLPGPGRPGRRLPGHRRPADTSWGMAAPAGG
ncbi:hypothetical protein ACFWXO_27995 [Kitasatospora sp. NPDC059088]|uniref:hypothetical protein n=1 Tax=Kitasatospora sp. NPDC059088 TaxID=3346722 RepID=UPI0036B941AF